MKTFWLGINILWSILFVVAIGYIFFQKTDTFDTIQTIELRLISFILIFVLFLFVFLCQLTWGVSLKKQQKKRKKD
ncbi:hypothetical protein DOK78_002268 [Enterococcus sp. DIV2402]|uniref:DUF3923 family protein n=1 Tax=Candidatus Enterococcus lowellii TaxID=2230877 RepID=A0ABZ2SRJ5_9ENTE|nr:DUF3923 family protein [Enterococcus sp. DIV2402]